MFNEMYESSQCDDRHLCTFSGRTESIWTMAYLPGGQRLVTGSEDKTIRIWTVGDGRQEGKEMVHAAGVQDFAVTRDGGRIISVDYAGNITVWDVATQELVEDWTHMETNPPIAMSADDRLLAYGSETIIIREMLNRRTKHRIEIGGDGMSLSFSRDGSKLAIGANDIFIYDVESGGRILTLEGHENWVTSLQWSRDGTKLYSASIDKTIRCWNTETGEQIGQPWGGHSNNVWSLSLSQDGTKLASGSDDRTVRFWDTSGHPIGHPLQHENKVWAVCVSPSNDMLAAAGADGNISFWRVPWRSDENPSSEPTPLPTPPVSSDVTTTTAYPTIRTQPREPSPNTESKSLDMYSFPAPPDLTRDIIRIDDQFSEVGGFGDVHKCIYNSASGAKEVAVKAFRFIFTLEEVGTKVAKMVRRELGIWKRLEHPNIVPFLGIATGFGLKGSTSIVSLWMSNGSLCQFLDSHGDELGVAHRLQMLSDVAHGLDYLHSFFNTPVIHGDLNCNNVLIDANFTARLADFGLSSFVGNIPQGLTYLGGATTRLGTLRWTSPEQLEDEYERAPQSDIYSFGCISLQVFSGQPPWSEVREDAAVVLRLAKGQNPQRPISRAMEDRHWEFVKCCWRSVGERPTARMLASSLHELLSSCPPSQPLREMFAPLSSQIDPVPSSGGAMLSPLLALPVNDAGDEN